MPAASLARGLQGMVWTLRFFFCADVGADEERGKRTVAGLGFFVATRVYWVGERAFCAPLAKRRFVSDSWLFFYSLVMLFP